MEGAGGRTLHFATTNADKVAEAREHLAPVADIVQFDYDYVEIQADDLGDIAAHGAREAFEAGDSGPVIVDDTGLYVRGLNGFPGPYAAFVEDTLGIERVWELAADLEDRRAAFRCAIGYADGEREEVFEAAVQGTLVPPRGDGGFGYDPIFEHDGRTFAEMDTGEKNAISHRSRALSKLAEWLADDDGAD
ncbi:MAG: RdgB/HAM1 family non-canonical purine NTP pyrophosphatase [Halodesulfurarchaeum sp.]